MARRLATPLQERGRRNGDNCNYIDTRDVGEALPAEVPSHSLRLYRVLLGARGARRAGRDPALPGRTVIGTFGPLVAAVVVTVQESGRAGLRSLFGRVVRWRVASFWYGVALLGTILLMLAGLALEVVALDGQPTSLWGLIGALPILAIVALYMEFFIGLGEEVGKSMSRFRLGPVGPGTECLLKRASRCASVCQFAYICGHLEAQYGPGLGYANCREHVFYELG